MPNNIHNVHLDAQLQQQYEQLYKAMKIKKVKEPTSDPESSRMIDTHQIPTELLRESSNSIDQELGELEGAIEDLTTITEVVGEIASTIRTRLSNLRMGAIHLGKKKWTGPQLGLHSSVPELAEEQFDLPVAVQTEQAGQAPAALAPLPGGQGSPYLGSLGQGLANQVAYNDIPAQGNWNLVNPPVGAGTMHIDEWAEIENQHG